MAITITTPENVRLLICGNNISVAEGFPQTLVLNETSSGTCIDPVTSPGYPVPGTINIGGGRVNMYPEVVNSFYDCIDIAGTYPLNTSTFNIEVINSKVVYERINKSSAIRFIDVTTRQNWTAHRHNIPVVNNTWAQNPCVNQGRVIVERWDPDNNVWIEVANMPINGTSLSNDLPLDVECTYRSRLVIYRRTAGACNPSPGGEITFEAIGEEFPLKAYYYEEDNLYIKNIVAEEGKTHLCEIEEPGTFTVEVEKEFRIEYDSYNIGYTYEYRDSVSNADDIGFDNPILTYNEPTRAVEGNLRDILCAVELGVIFYGCRNWFIDGLLTETDCQGLGTLGQYNCQYSEGYLIDCDPDDDVVIESKILMFEAIKPLIKLPVLQDECTYCMLFEDMTKITNPCLAGDIIFEYRFNDADEWCELDKIKPLEMLHKCFCESGLLFLRQKYKFDNSAQVTSPKAADNRYYCGCKHIGENPDPIYFETDWYYYNLELQQYKPEIRLEEVTCCHLVTEEYTIQPVHMDLHEYFCTIPTYKEWLRSIQRPRDLEELCEGWEELTEEELEPDGYLPSTLTYKFYKYNSSIKQWEEVERSRIIYQIDAPIVLEHADGTPFTNEEILDFYAQYEFSYDFADINSNDTVSVVEDNLGAYKLTASLENCCHETEIEIYVNVCDVLQITADCDPEFIRDFRDTNGTDCNCSKYHFKNHSLTDTYFIEVYNTKLETVVDDFEIAPDEYIEYQFTDDGIYTLTYYNMTLDPEAVRATVRVLYIFCIGNECYTNLVKDILCDYAEDCFCDDDEVIRDRLRLNKIMALYQTWMRFIERDYYLKSRYNAVDIEAKLETFDKANAIYDQLIEICKPCVEPEGGCCAGNNVTRK